MPQSSKTIWGRVAASWEGRIDWADLVGGQVMEERG